jgi:DNA-binding NarL/FixJ family response regulator
MEGHDRRGAEMTEDLKENIARTIKDEWGSRICGITPMGLRPCKSGATCACSETAGAILNMIKEAGYVIVKRIDHATPNAETVEAMSECHPWYGPGDALLPDGGCAECLKASRIKASRISVPASYVSVGSSDERRKLADRIAGLAHGAVLVESERDMIVAALRAEKSGIFAGLTDEQKRQALEYRGEENHGGHLPSHADISDSLKEDIARKRPICSQGKCDDPDWCNCPPIGCRYGSEPSYADKADGATTFNPEEQFEKDNGL